MVGDLVAWVGVVEHLDGHHYFTTAIISCYRLLFLLAFMLFLALGAAILALLLLLNALQFAIDDDESGFRVFVLMKATVADAIPLSSCLIHLINVLLLKREWHFGQFVLETILILLLSTAIHRFLVGVRLLLRSGSIPNELI